MWLKSFDNRIFSYTQYFLLQHTNLSPNSFLEIFLCLVISYLSLKLSRNYSFPLLYTLLIILPLQFLHHQENNNLHLYFYLFCSIFFFSLWVRRIAYFFFFPFPPPLFFFLSWIISTFSRFESAKQSVALISSLIFAISEKVFKLSHASDLSVESSEARELAAFSQFLHTYHADISHENYCVRTPLGKICKYFLATLYSALNIKIEAFHLFQLTWIEK